MPSVVHWDDVFFGEPERDLGDSVAPPEIGRSRRGVSLLGLEGPLKTLFSCSDGRDLRNASGSGVGSLLLAGVGVLSAPWSTERGVVDRADVVLGELGREPGDSVALSGIGRLRLNRLAKAWGPLRTLACWDAFCFAKWSFGGEGGGSPKRWFLAGFCPGSFFRRHACWLGVVFSAFSLALVLGTEGLPFVVVVVCGAVCGSAALFGPAATLALCSTVQLVGLTWTSQCFVRYWYLMRGVWVVAPCLRRGSYWGPRRPLSFLPLSCV